MALMKLCLCLLLVVVAAAPHSYAAPDSVFFGGYAPALLTEDDRRLLFQYGYDGKLSREKYFSYKGHKFSNVPCGLRGSSYYDCTKRRKVKPYPRGCAAITGCPRITDSMIIRF